MVTKNKREISLINHYLDKKNVNRELQTRIRNYIQYMHLEEKEQRLVETNEVILKLSG